MNSHVAKPASQSESKIRRKRPELLPTPESFVKTTGKNGRVIYIHPAEGRVSHVKLTLYDTLNLHFGALRSVLDFMDDETVEKFGTLLEIVIQNAENHVDKVFELLEKDADIKNIEVHVVRRGNSFWRPGWVAGLTITRKEVDNERTRENHKGKRAGHRRGDLFDQANQGPGGFPKACQRVRL